MKLFLGTSERKKIDQNPVKIRKCHLPKNKTTFFHLLIKCHPCKKVPFYSLWHHLKNAWKKVAVIFFKRNNLSPTLCIFKIRSNSESRQMTVRWKKGGATEHWVWYCDLLDGVWGSNLRIKFEYSLQNSTKCQIMWRCHLQEQRPPFHVIRLYACSLPSLDSLKDDTFLSFLLYLVFLRGFWSNPFWKRWMGEYMTIKLFGRPSSISIQQLFCEKYLQNLILIFLPVGIFEALQSYRSRLSVVLLSYDSKSTLIRRDDWANWKLGEGEGVLKVSESDSVRITIFDNFVPILKVSKSESVRTG